MLIFSYYVYQYLHINAAFFPICRQQSWAQPGLNVMSRAIKCVMNGCHNKVSNQYFYRANTKNKGLYLKYSSFLEFVLFELQNMKCHQQTQQ